MLIMSEIYNIHRMFCAKISISSVGKGTLALRVIKGKE